MSKGKVVGMRYSDGNIPEQKVFDSKGKLLRIEKPPEINWDKLNQQRGLRK